MTEIQSDTILIRGILYRIAAVDIGNSRIKILIEKKFFQSDFSFEWQDKLTLFLKSLNNVNFIFGVSQVNQIIYDEFRKIIQNYSSFKLIDSIQLLEQQDKLKYNHISGIGTDRLLGMLGALDLCELPLITIDCGTASTVNFVNEMSECIGGYIFAGPKTQIRALAEFTYQLNEIKLFNDENIIGINTEDAIRLGIIYSTVGAIKEAILRNNIDYSSDDFKSSDELKSELILKKENFPKKLPTLIFTGGLGELIFENFGNYTGKMYYIENLILKGIIYLLKNLNFDILDLDNLDCLKLNTESND